MDYEGQVISVIAAGKLLGIAKNVAYAGVRSGQIPAIRIGGRWIVPLAALERLLAEGSNSLKPSAPDEAGPNVSTVEVSDPGEAKE